MQRRKFLLTGAALGCSAAASPLLTPIAFAQAPWENRLVVIILRGALDGLDVVQPFGDPDFAALRPSLAGVEGLTDLDGYHALHPGLTPLLPLWQAQQLGFVHAVSTPYRDKRSHFDGQDILEAGTPGLTSEGARDGWLNRMLQTVPNLTAETAYAIGREQLLILTGAAPAARWSPDARMLLSPQARQLLAMVQQDDPLFRAATEDAVMIVDDLAAEEGGEMAETALRGDHVKLAQFAASRLRGETRIASFSISGWDTHNRQAAGLSRALSRLSDTLLTLQTELGPVWGQTAVICMTEFGRTARENGTAGTDHGTGGAMILAGGAVRGGQVVADWPGLADSDLYAGRDLMPTRDVRAHAGWVMRGLFGLNAGVIEQAVFPGLELGPDPGLLL
jgi:uncharacterized protein (DUF1501 family)